MTDILHRIGIKAPLAEVYNAVATREGVAGWWTVDASGDSKLGGVLNFAKAAPAASSSKTSKNDGA